MQLRTLTMWCNKHLDKEQHIENLEEEFWDGSKMGTLVETLLKKKGKF